VAGDRLGKHSAHHPPVFQEVKPRPEWQRQVVLPATRQVALVHHGSVETADTWAPAPERRLEAPPSAAASHGALDIAGGTNPVLEDGLVRPVDIGEEVIDPLRAAGSRARSQGRCQSAGADQAGQGIKGKDALAEHPRRSVEPERGRRAALKAAAAATWLRLISSNAELAQGESRGFEWRPRGSPLPVKYSSYPLRGSTREQSISLGHD